MVVALALAWDRARVGSTPSCDSLKIKEYLKTQEKKTAYESLIKRLFLLYSTLSRMLGASSGESTSVEEPRHF